MSESTIRVDYHTGKENVISGSITTGELGRRKRRALCRSTHRADHTIHAIRS